jgi:hypothetical protein
MSLRLAYSTHWYDDYDIDSVEQELITWGLARGESVPWVIGRYNVPCGSIPFACKSYLARARNEFTFDQLTNIARAVSRIERTWLEAARRRAGFYVVTDDDPALIAHALLVRALSDRPVPESPAGQRKVARKAPAAPRSSRRSAPTGDRS